MLANALLKLSLFIELLQNKKATALVACTVNSSLSKGRICDFSVENWITNLTNLFSFYCYNEWNNWKIPVIKCN